MKNFNETFKELFKGGSADLKLIDPDNILESGIDIWNPKNKFYMIDEKNIKLSDILKIKEKYPYFFKLP